MATAKKKLYVVKAEAAVVFVNTAAERYLYKGAVIPAEVTADEVKRLVELDLVAESGDVVEEPVDPAEPAA